MSDGAKLLAIGAAAMLFVALAGVGSLLGPRPLEAFTFYVFAGTMVLSSLAIIISRNIVRSATWLLGTLGGAAGLYLLLSANFLAAIQLIVYAGGVLILIVFGVMLTAKNPFVRFEAKPREVWTAAVVGGVLFVGLCALLLAPDWPAIPGAAPSERVEPVARIGEALLTDYLLPFEVVSVLLLAVMIGAAYLARPQKR